MLTAFLVSHILIWVIVILLAMICLALVRQVGVLYERVAPAGALAINRKLSAGERAPWLSVTTLGGHPLTIGLPAESNAMPKCQLLFFLSPACPICKTLLPVVASLHKDERRWLDIILASDGEDFASHQAFVQQQDLKDFPYVVCEALGVTYGVSKLPYGVLIDEKGLISALGIVNSREHLESLFEAKKAGMPSIQEYQRRAKEL
jgi:methylamine dehydrogenase accessory protein MauD